MTTFIIFVGRSRSSYRKVKETVTAYSKLVANKIAAGRYPGKWVTVRDPKELK